MFPLLSLHLALQGVKGRQRKTEQLRDATPARLLLSKEILDIDPSKSSLDLRLVS